MPGLNRSSSSELASRLRRALLQPQASGCELLQIPNLTRFVISRRSTTNASSGRLEAEKSRKACLLSNALYFDPLNPADSSVRRTHPFSPRTIAQHKQIHKNKFIPPSPPLRFSYAPTKRGQLPHRLSPDAYFILFSAINLISTHSNHVSDLYSFFMSLLLLLEHRTKYLYENRVVSLESSILFCSLPPSACSLIFGSTSL